MLCSYAVGIWNECSSSSGSQFSMSRQYVWHAETTENICCYYIRQVNAVNGGDIVMLDSVRRSVTSL